MGREEKALVSLGSSSPKPKSKHEKSLIRQVPIEAHSTKYLTSPPQNCQGHQKQGKSEQLSQPRGA